MIRQATTSPRQQDDPFETPAFGHTKDGNAALGSSPSASGSGPSGGLEAQEPGHQSGRCLTFEELLGRNTQAGPWMEAFSVVDADLGDLSGKRGKAASRCIAHVPRIATDVIGNILELYNFAGQPGVAEVLRVGPPRSYASLSGLPQSSLPPQSITTSNSSPALTLASNTTPMHRAAEDSSQDFVEPAEDQGDGSIPLAPAPNPLTMSTNSGSSTNADMER
ncbi:hypothetical protein FRC00_008914 [Tulasnella sp. 408]|nr:hypothetical protein FRC00_008914 [Tulasnella sp. 408]